MECDRCGKTVEWRATFPNELLLWKYLAFFRGNKSKLGDRPWEDAHLCPSCGEAFRVWLENGPDDVDQGMVPICFDHGVPYANCDKCKALGAKLS